MGKEKQIENLTAIIDSFNIKTYENAKAVAKFIIEKYNYRKINENEIVISKEEYEKLLNQECLRGWIWKEGFNDGKKLYCEQIAQMRDTIENLIQEKHRWVYQARKETAREYHEKMKKVIQERDYVEGYAEIGLQEENDEIAKQFSVDLGE